MPWAGKVHGGPVCRRLPWLWGPAATDWTICSEAWDPRSRDRASCSEVWGSRAGAGHWLGFVLLPAVPAGSWVLPHLYTEGNRLRWGLSSSDWTCVNAEGGPGPQGAGALRRARGPVASPGGKRCLSLEQRRPLSQETWPRDSTGHSWTQRGRSGEVAGEANLPQGCGLR